MKSRTVILRQLLTAGVDALLVAAAFLLAYIIRFYSGWIPLAGEIPPLSQYTRPLGIIVFIYLYFFRAAGLYAPRRRWRPLEAFGAVAHGAALASIALMALTFFYRNVSYSRVVALLACWGFTTILVALGRFVLGRALALWLPRWQAQPRLLILGTGPTAAHLIQRLRATRGPPIVGVIHLPHPATSATPPGTAFHGAPILGTLDTISPLLTQHAADEVVLTEPALPRQQIMDLVLLCEQTMVNFRMVPDLLGLLTTHVGIQHVDGIPLLGLRETPLMNPWLRFVKRTMDLVVATLGLMLTLPLWAATAWCIRRDSPGPIFYHQERVGEDGRSFHIIKFRTMRVGAEVQTGPVWATPNDDRRTRVGRILRRWNLDELPQLLNVLRGDMSLVGPRPERPHFVSQFKYHIPRYMARHRIRSGITGWAQIHGLRGDTSIEERTKYDLYYLENWSLWLDGKILWKSWRAVKNAY